MVNNMFMGEYLHTIDAKGRLTVPSKLREGLGDTFVVTKGLDGCLYAYTESEWEKFIEKLTTLPMTNADSRKFVRFFLSGAASVEPDKMGRILIPQTLRNHAGLDKDVVLLGVASRVEIWDKAKWEDGDYSDMETIAQRMDELGLGI